MLVNKNGKFIEQLQVGPSTQSSGADLPSHCPRLGNIHLPKSSALGQPYQNHLLQSQRGYSSWNTRLWINPAKDKQENSIH